MGNSQCLQQRNATQNNDLWKNVYFASPQPILIGGSDDSIYDLNLAAKKILGLENEDIVGKKVHELISRIEDPFRSFIRVNRSVISDDKENFFIFYLQDINNSDFSDRLLLFFATTLKSLDFPSDLSLDFTAMISKTGHVAIKSFCDWCQIDLIRGSGVSTEAVASANTVLLPSLPKLQNDFFDVDDSLNPLKVIRSGAAVLVPNIAQDLEKQQPFVSPNFMTFQKGGINSYICVPIKKGSITLGCVSFGRSKEKDSFDSIDLIMAEEFATKVGFNIERAQLYQNLEELKRKADAANQAKTNFLANVSHEIRTPLGAIIGFAELLTNTDQSNPDYLKWKEKIRSNSGYLLRIIDDILDLSKVEAGKINLEITKINLSNMLCNVYETAKDRATDKPVQLVFAAKEPIPNFIYTDETRLTQILNNIVGNAIKFTNEGFVQLTVGWEKGNSDLLVFEIRDSGIGISNTQRHNLFKPFSQADTSLTRQYGGTGLGLALSRNLARQLGGEVILENSELQKGSIFKVTINPGKFDKCDVFQELIFDVPVTGTEHEQGPGITLPLKDKRILVVEDSSDIQILIKRFLEGAGATIVSALNGEEGVKLALSDNYDVILMDVQMPFKDGCEATRELRGMGYEGLIIALTAHAMKEEYDSCAKAGYDAHLSKPIRRKDLIANIIKFEREHQKKQIKS